jgi:hypothetical protein
MNKILYLAVTLLPLNALSQIINIQRAHQNIISYLKKTLNDPASFSVASWGKPEKIYEDFETSYEAKGMDDLIDSGVSAQNKLHDFRFNMELKSNKPDTLLKDTVYRLCLNVIKQVDRRVDSLKRMKELKRQSFKPYLFHYNIQLSFRAKNGYNALRLANYTFFLDRHLNVTDYDDDDK